MLTAILHSCSSGASWSIYCTSCHRNACPHPQDRIYSEAVRSARDDTRSRRTSTDLELADARALRYTLRLGERKGVREREEQADV